MDEKYNISFFERLQKGQLTASELSEYRAALATDKTLEAESKAYADIFGGFEQLEQQNFLKEVVGWERSLREGEAKTSVSKVVPMRRQIRPFLKIAAVLLPLLIIGEFFIYQNYNDQNLVGDAYSMPLLSSVRSADGPADASDLDGILSDLKNREFENAQNNWNQLTPAIQNSSTGQLLLLQLNLSQRNYDQALAIGQNIGEPNNKQQLELDWYLALAKMGADTKKSEVIEALKKVAENGANPHELEAKKLLKKYTSVLRNFVF